MESISKLVCTMIILSLVGAEIANASNQRWCCKSELEFAKCRYLKTLRADNIEVFPFACVYADGTSECIEMIKNVSADIMFLDGGDIYRSEGFLSVIAAEDYGEGDASYYAVAVVKRDAPEEVDILNLLQVAREDGEVRLKSCHTGVGKTSGWNTPIGWLARQVNRRDSEGHLELVDPFLSSCAPGAKNPTYTDKLPKPHDSEKWCKLCIGNEKGEHQCDRDNDERYYGYDGAFSSKISVHVFIGLVEKLRSCMKKGAGDIAFVKHTTVSTAEQEDFSLLCPEGGRAHPKEWKNCNFARVPAHGLMMRSDTSLETAEVVYDELVFAKNHMSETDFTSYLNISNLLWKSSTENFLGPYIKNSRQYLRREYYCNMKALDGEIMPEECV